MEPMRSTCFQYTDWTRSLASAAAIRPTATRSAPGTQNVDEGLPQGACGVEGKVGLPAAGPGEGMPQLVGKVCCGSVDDSGGTELEGAGGLVVGGGDRR